MNRVILICIAALSLHAQNTEPLITPVVSPPVPGSANPGYVATINYLDSTPPSGITGFSLNVNVSPGWMITGALGEAAMQGTLIGPVLTGPTYAYFNMGGSTVPLPSGQMFSVFVSPPNTTGTSLLVMVLLPVGATAAGDSIPIPTAPTAYLCSDAFPCTAP